LVLVFIDPFVSRLSLSVLTKCVLNKKCDSIEYYILLYRILISNLAAPSGNPEIWWISKTESSPEGGDELGFIGKKFASGFKVRFFSREDDGKNCT